MKTRSLKNILVAGTATALVAAAAAFILQPLAYGQDDAAPVANIVRDPHEVPAPITAMWCRVMEFSPFKRVRR